MPKNPPAFPHQYGASEHGASEQGMTLRDYFAAKAMQGLCVDGLSNVLMTHQIAKMSFNIADAMLKQREI